MARPNGRASVTKSHKIFQMFALCPNIRRAISHNGRRQTERFTEKMIATYFGYVTLGILLAIALIGAYYLGK